MRQRKNKNRIWIILGGSVLVVVIIVGVGKFFPSKPSVSIARSILATSTSSSMSSTTFTTFGQMSVRGNTVVARGRNYELSPVNGLTSPGFFAVEGRIVQIISDPTTKSQTPYYFVVQDSSGSALVGVVVPTGEETAFNVSAFPVGSNVLIAGTIFPSVNPAAEVFDYSQLLQELNIARGLQQLNVPTSTPFIGANFRDMAVMS